jgi:hypothetical protein
MEVGGRVRKVVEDVQGEFSSTRGSIATMAIWYEW